MKWDKNENNSRMDKCDFSVFISIKIQVLLQNSNSSLLVYVCQWPIIRCIGLNRSKFMKLILNFPSLDGGWERTYFVSFSIPSVISLEQNVKCWWKLLNLYLRLWLQNSKKNQNLCKKGIFDNLVVIFRENLSFFASCDIIYNALATEIIQSFSRVIITAAFYGERDIKMGHSILRIV